MPNSKSNTSVTSPPADATVQIPRLLTPSAAVTNHGFPAEFSQLQPNFVTVTYESSRSRKLTINNDCCLNISLDYIRDTIVNTSKREISSKRKELRGYVAMVEADISHWSTQLQEAHDALDELMKQGLDITIPEPPPERPERPSSRSIRTPGSPSRPRRAADKDTSSSAPSAPRPESSPKASRPASAPARQQLQHARARVAHTQEQLRQLKLHLDRLDAEEARVSSIADVVLVDAAQPSLVLSQRLREVRYDPFLAAEHAAATALQAQAAAAAAAAAPAGGGASARGQGQGQSGIGKLRAQREAAAPANAAPAAPAPTPAPVPMSAPSSPSPSPTAAAAAAAAATHVSPPGLRLSLGARLHCAALVVYADAKPGALGVPLELPAVDAPVTVAPFNKE